MHAFSFVLFLFASSSSDLNAEDVLVRAQTQGYWMPPLTYPKTEFGQFHASYRLLLRGALATDCILRPSDAEFVESKQRSCGFLPALEAGLGRVFLESSLKRDARGYKHFRIQGKTYFLDEPSTCSKESKLPRRAVYTSFTKATDAKKDNLSLPPEILLRADAQRCVHSKETLDEILALFKQDANFESSVRSLIAMSLYSDCEEWPQFVKLRVLSLFQLGLWDEAEQSLLREEDKLRPKEADIFGLSYAWMFFRKSEDRQIEPWLNTFPKESKVHSEWKRWNLKYEQNKKRTGSTAQAALFGIFPGGGYLSLGLYESAALSFSFTGGFAAASYEFAANDLIVPSILSAVVSSMFYVGSIVGAVRAQQARNEVILYEDLGPELLLEEAPRSPPMRTSVSGLNERDDPSVQSVSSRSSGTSSPTSSSSSIRP